MTPEQVMELMKFMAEAKLMLRIGFIALAILMLCMWIDLYYKIRDGK